jgi:hypothetical protein
MRIRPAELELIRAGSVDLAFRRWDRPRVLVGTRMRNPIGLVEVTSVDVVEPGSITDRDARRAGNDSRNELLAMLESRPGRDVYRVGLRFAGDDPRVALRTTARLSAADRDALAGWLERLDGASRHGAWTRATLELIAANPEVRAPDLAEQLGLETVVFKRNVRKLKERGLTESLPVGYRISPRGKALLSHLRRIS